jgi:hypothetical protein
MIQKKNITANIVGVFKPKGIIGLAGIRLV